MKGALGDIGVHVEVDSINRRVARLEQRVDKRGNCGTFG